MKHFLATVILLYAAGLAKPAMAEDRFHGEWQQIFSNAGACTTCRITILQNGASLEILANNDWIAIAETRDRRTANGAGFWKQGTRKTYAGKAFDIRLWHSGYDELAMTMRIEAARGKSHTIKALFKRIERRKV
ncbi:hypothetical protein WMC41_16530 [Shinella yambaruensis]|uniref:hypothetical protein n=1 Tax=Shinella yambaruensis TaxID=415996 RepID=UPI003D79B078